MDSITLPAGHEIEIDAGAHRLIIARDKAGHIGVADERGAYLPPLPDSSAQNKFVFEVLPNHAANSDGGAEAASIGEALDGGGGVDTLPEGGGDRLVAYLAGLAERAGLSAAGWVCARVAHPDISLRQLALKMHTTRTTASDMAARIAKHDARLASILDGYSAKAARSQRRRRRRERKS